MKNHPDPTSIPQTEGHPEAFPKVTTLPTGWDLSGSTVPQATSAEIPQNAIPLNLDVDARAAVGDSLA